MVDNVSSSPPPKIYLHEKFESNFCLTSSLSTDNQAFSGIRGLRLQPASTMGKAEVAIFQISAISPLDQISANARGTISRNKYFRLGKRTHLSYQLLITCPTSHSHSQSTGSQLDRGLLFSDLLGTAPSPQLAKTLPPSETPTPAAAAAL